MQALSLCIQRVITQQHATTLLHSVCFLPILYLVVRLCLSCQSFPVVSVVGYIIEWVQLYCIAGTHTLIIWWWHMLWMVVLIKWWLTSVINTQLNHLPNACFPLYNQHYRDYGNTMFTTGVQGLIFINGHLCGNVMGFSKQFCLCHQLLTISELASSELVISIQCSLWRWTAAVSVV